MPNPILNPNNVKITFDECLAQPNDEDMFQVECWKETAIFSQSRLESYREYVGRLLGELPSRFKDVGGSSFLVGYMDKYEQNWTENKYYVERLFLLGIGLGLITEIPTGISQQVGIPYFYMHDFKPESVEKTPVDELRNDLIDSTKSDISHVPREAISEFVNAMYCKLNDNQNATHDIVSIMLIKLDEIKKVADEVCKICGYRAKAEFYNLSRTQQEFGRIYRLLEPFKSDEVKNEKA